MSISLGWLRLGRRERPQRDPEGRMTLVEHLRELRQRLFKALIAVAVGTIVGWVFREELYDLVFMPLKEALVELTARRDIDARPNFDNPISPLTLNLKLALMAGLVATCPVWLYQLWAFIVPGLHSAEKKWTRIFAATAAPLFLAGVLVGYTVMPVALEFILNLTPEGGELQPSNFIKVDFFLDFVIRLLLVFGVAFEIPIFVIALNRVGILTGERLAKWRRIIIFSFFVFAAVATPTGDPITMMLLAGPMTLLYIAGELVARAMEKRRRERLIAEGMYFDVSVSEEDLAEDDDEKKDT